jgi:SAM-dependent methyltransferase
VCHDAALVPQALEATLTDIARSYPPALRAGQLEDVPRIAFNVGLVAERVEPGATVCDIGGGVGMFSLGCAALGLRAMLVDDLSDEVNRREGAAALELHREHGVEIVQRDVIEDGLELEPGSLGAVTSFDSMEHWHHSPKGMFHGVRSALADGGLFVISTPNCANLRKRVLMPFGKVKWTSMEEWYEHERFRGHVREPDVEDLRYIARDLGLRDAQVLGRNWMGYRGGTRGRRLAAQLLDRPLRRRPQLCSDIYLIGRAA